MNNKLFKKAAQI